MYRKDTVSASELGEYVYCIRCWWKVFTGKKKETTPLMQSGTIQHNRLATQVERNHIRSALAFLFIFFGILLLIIVYILYRLYD